MIIYPKLDEQLHITVTAPSSGVSKEYHHYFDKLKQKAEKNQWELTIGETAYLQDRVRSTDAETRARELNHFLQDASINCIIPPWGGELLLEVLPLIEYENVQPKWILGYSDISSLLFALTLKTGIATAHGPGAAELRGELLDQTTAQWEPVLRTLPGETIQQVSSEKYQEAWDYSRDTFVLTKKTQWLPLDEYNYPLEGCLLGGCIDILRHLIGTEYGDVKQFQADLQDEPILWYLENCELLPVDLKRSLLQMKMAGWFDNCAGILFGRTMVHDAQQGYTVAEVHQEMAELLNVPVITEVDCGHVPPQLTFINGARGRVFSEGDQWVLEQEFVE